MMIYPSIDSLLEKVNSTYTLVTLSAKRARQLQDGTGHLMVEHPRSDKAIGQALEEINAGLLYYKN
ncbi:MULTISPECIES: DNA-directed RNA polymerase subunit omega [unclassified Sporolactobacillus]|uniref:DNA-directed RNA polymerase subunit omega n=1 Tax=unclassified Sporolactobacillus TaxID=2628533 RepID=UPI002367F4E3|nr:DNA-directed RNA polymerase subunit omega [Sporolactobacillus sp. CQH2019]MDD9147112.1 DNA-directed RNA polymerase subunit omega [Sporolactobacillus sp. CQH2019]